jgi:hypothetical protein
MPETYRSNDNAIYSNITFLKNEKSLLQISFVVFAIILKLNQSESQTITPDQALAARV